MRLLLCIILVLPLLGAQAGCAKVASFMINAVVAGLFDDDDDCDGPSIQPNERQIRSDEQRLARGESLRYHQDERELRRHRDDVRAMKQMQARRN